MKIVDAITRTNLLKSNVYSELEQVRWLSTLDGMVKEQIIDTHEGGNVIFNGYDDSTDTETELLVPEPYSEMYLHWLEAQIDYYNGEYDKYNNAMAMFNTAYNNYNNYYNRTHMPLGKKMKYFGEPEHSAKYKSANSVAMISIKEV